MYEVDRRRLLLVTVAVFMLLLIRAARPVSHGPSPSPWPHRVTKPAPFFPSFLGFYENAGTSGAGRGSYPSLVAHAGELQMVAPLWYQVSGDGNLAAAHPDPAVADFAGSHHLLMLPMFINLGDGMLQTISLRAKTVQTILEQVAAGGYSGVFIDFELLPPADRGPFTLFMQDLASRLHAEGKKLGVAVFPKVGVPNSLNGAYDYAALGTDCDYVVVMAYDAHYDSSPPGPVAPLSWVQDNVREALRYIPAARVFLGIGAYGYDWPPAGKAATVSTIQAKALAKRYGARVLWDYASGEPHFTYWVGGARHQVWYENRWTFDQKYSLVKTYHLGGFALWRLHFEDPGIWGDLARLRPKV